jgi:hypothetical protein
MAIILLDASDIYYLLIFLFFFFSFPLFPLIFMHDELTTMRNTVPIRVI